MIKVREQSLSECGIVKAPPFRKFFKKIQGKRLSEAKVFAETLPGIRFGRFLFFLSLFVTALSLFVHLEIWMSHPPVATFTFY